MVLPFVNLVNLRRGQNDATLLTINTWKSGQLLDIKIQSEKGVNDVIKLQVWRVEFMKNCRLRIFRLLSYLIGENFCSWLGNSYPYFSVEV